MPGTLIPDNARWPAAGMNSPSVGGDADPADRREVAGAGG